MFAGIIEHLGRVTDVGQRGGTTVLRVSAAPPFEDVAVGESIAVDGVCLTAVQVTGEALSFDVVPETLSRTTLGRRRPGDLVNLERSLRLGELVGGLGHAVELLPQVTDKGAKGAKLDKKQDLLFTVKVVVYPSQAYAGVPGHRPHRGLLIPGPSHSAGGDLQDVVQALIVTLACLRASALHTVVTVSLEYIL